jgi:hypothetical protein
VIGYVTEFAWDMGKVKFNSMKTQQSIFEFQSGDRRGGKSGRVK